MWFFRFYISLAVYFSVLSVHYELNLDLKQKSQLDVFYKVLSKSTCLVWYWLQSSFRDILAQSSLCSSSARLIVRPDFLLSLLLPSFSQTFNCFALVVFRQPLDSVSSQQQCHRRSTMSGQACQVHSWHFKHTSVSTCSTLLPPKGQHWQHNIYLGLKEFV